MSNKAPVTAYPVTAIVCCYGYLAERSEKSLNGYTSYLLRVTNRLRDLSEEGRLMGLIFSGGITDPKNYPDRSEAQEAYEFIRDGWVPPAFWDSLPFMQLEEESQNTPQNIYNSTKRLMEVFSAGADCGRVPLAEEMKDSLRKGRILTGSLLPDVQIFCDKARANKARVIARHVNSLLSDPEWPDTSIIRYPARYKVVGITRRDTSLVSLPIVQNLQAMKMLFKPQIVDELIGI